MHEHIAHTVYYLGVHLLYASMVWLAALALTSAVRSSATVKYWIWVMTSLNFLLPVGAVLDQSFGRYLSWAAPLRVIGPLGIAAADHSMLIGALWLLGATLMVARLALRLRSERVLPTRGIQRAGESATAMRLRGIPVRFTADGQGPAVKGVLSPYIALPLGIEAALSGPELNAVLLHELTHARRRDNLIRLVHELGQCALWFYPLLWLAGSRLALYRELSCDEAVIQRDQGKDLVAALAKLANPESALVLQAAAASHMSRRVARLIAAGPRSCFAVNTLLLAVFAAVLFLGVFETVAHTACCFVGR
jgi:beta-lactamase regulating signal transducer with metallopeptidase domain